VPESIGNTLTELIYSGQFRELHEPVQQIFSGQQFHRVEGLTQLQRAERSYDLLRYAAAKIGKTREVVENPRLLLSFYEWACIHAPDLLPLISGHYNLTTGSLLTLGNGREELEPYLRDLDTIASVGVLLINEFDCGSNVAFLETTATYDHADRSFVLHTPHHGATKFMPNVGAPVPRVTIVVARLVADDIDRGIFPFVVRLRGPHGKIAAGVTIRPLPDKPMLPMDNAMISFDRARVPFESWLSSDVADIDTDGTFRYLRNSGTHDAFRRTMSQFTFGRVALASSMIASARSALLLFARYIEARKVHAFLRHHPPMIKMRNVQRSFFRSLAVAYACTFFANGVKDQLCSTQSLSDPGVQLQGLLAKFFLVRSAQDIIGECRERCGAHGMFSVNRIADYLGLVNACSTAEGDTQVLQLAAGRQLILDRRYAIASVPALDLKSLCDATSWVDLFRAREHYYLARGRTKMNSSLRDGQTVFDRWNDCIHDATQLADAHVNRRAMEMFRHAIDHAPDGKAREALRLTAELYVLEYVSRHAGPYLVEGHLSHELFDELDIRYAEICDRLVEHLPLLVEAFAIDERILDAPIAASNHYEAYERRDR
jgi:acyl-CoA oxidase